MQMLGSPTRTIRGMTSAIRWIVVLLLGVLIGIVAGRYVVDRATDTTGFIVTPETFRVEKGTLGRTLRDVNCSAASISRPPNAGRSMLEGRARRLRSAATLATEHPKVDPAVPKRDVAADRRSTTLALIPAGRLSQRARWRSAVWHKCLSQPPCLPRARYR